MVVNLIFSVISSHVPHQYLKFLEKGYESGIRIRDHFCNGITGIALGKWGDVQT